jgi:Pyridine nucleotide-disulphide oxidoreductase
VLDALLEGLVEGPEALLGPGDGLAGERDQDAAEGLGLGETGVPAEPVVIAGGGNSAGQAAIWLADRGHRVTIAVRGTDLAESMSRYLIDRITGRPYIEVRDHTVVRDLHGSQWLERVGVENLTTRAHETLPAAALVVLVGAEPTPDGSPDPSCSTRAATSSPARLLTPTRVTGRRGPAATTIPTCWRPARRAYSPRAMSAAAR